MNRETKEFVTTGNHKVVYKAWLSGREYSAIEAVYIGAANIEMGPDMKPSIKNVNMNVEAEATKKLIEMAVVSVDEKKEGLVDVILDLPYQECAEITDLLKKISGKKK